MSKNEYNNALRNVDDDITKCEEFLCKVLDAKTRTPKFCDKPEAMANNRQTVGSASGSRSTKSVRHLTPPVKLTKSTAPRHCEPCEPKIIERQKPHHEKTPLGRSVSCCSERSSKRSVLVVEDSSQNNQIEEEIENMGGRTSNFTHPVVRKQSWSQLLADNHRNSMTRMPGAHLIPTVFNDFDPVRTLHFLTHELQNKLYILTPEETSVHRIVTEIQQSLHRLPYLPQSNAPPDVASSDIITCMNLMQNGFKPPVVSETSSLMLVNRTCQTDISLEAVLQSQKEQEFTRMKLELNCKNLNEACAEAIAESDDLKDSVKTLQNNNQLLVAEIEKLKNNSNIISPSAERIIEDLKIKNQILLKEKETIIKEHQFKISLLEDSINKIKKENEEEYSTYMGVKLELEKKNALLGTKDAQLDILKKELLLVQEMVKLRMSDEEKKKKEALNKSKDKLSRIRDKCITPTSSLSTLPESIMTRSPCRELKYNDMGRSSKMDHYQSFKMSKNYENIKDRSSSQDFKISQKESRYNIMRRKYRVDSSVEQESKLTLQDSMCLEKITDTEGGSQGDVASVADIFQEIRQEVLQKPNVTLPSPPRNLKMPNMSSSQSQWSDSM